MSEPSSQSGPQGEAESVEGREDPFTLWTPASITVTCLGVVLEALLILHGLFLLGDGVMAFSMAFAVLGLLLSIPAQLRARERGEVSVAFVLAIGWILVVGAIQLMLPRGGWTFG
ncbi:MAG TPA: hypothetical protein RMH85_01965 [Polyangiaceae bacterium LLY-WYZ-15_(1-7)]|nr:hypothetical protein [Polyangiaceae bacterium LLY-WYZ-15_(1-7)]HJL00252.1 hypothetical protein [Polyangiaceae bacterium LLY-WYZ-15_(1-7)]HJL07231.1 hypothetical protein [Polyangiaceae bacterium LLY-WYZ-15_(1-7)]HJL21791.1 hypothetical protein [Polyangiaceae bacterium LLY-WYZ-15_(1-7)]HJL34805.1 hypothetical protein [Polyangiaceae bacterium LLY-WYZ-15_(1-7)]